MSRLLAACAVGFALAAGAAEAQPASAPAARIDWVSVRLIYETTGSLSADMIGPEGFSTRNAVIGGEGAKEPARDLLVQIFFSIPAGADGNRVREPLSVVVTSSRWGRMASRTFKAPHLFRGGKAARTVYVPNAACARRLTVSARIGGERRDVVATLECGD